MSNQKPNTLTKEIAGVWNIPKRMLAGNKEDAGFIPTNAAPSKYTLTAHLQAAAVKCDTYHVFADYAPHVDTLSVVVRSKATNYQAPFAEWPAVLLSEYVRLSGEDAADRLVAIVERLRGMGVVV